MCVHNLCNESTSISNKHFCLILILILINLCRLGPCPGINVHGKKQEHNKSLSPFLSLSESLSLSVSLLSHFLMITTVVHCIHHLHIYIIIYIYM